MLVQRDRKSRGASGRLRLSRSAFLLCSFTTFLGVGYTRASGRTRCPDRGQGPGVEVDGAVLYLYREGGGAGELLVVQHLIAFIGAVAAYGGFVIAQAYKDSIGATGGPQTALTAFVAFYVTCVAVTRFFYFRKNAEIRCQQEEGAERPPRRFDLGRRAIDYAAVLLQTITTIEGAGLNSPSPLDLTYTVPQCCTAGVQYVRAGNADDGMVNVMLLKDGKAMRYFSVAAGSSTHVPLSMVDELPARRSRPRAKARGP